MSKAVGQAGYAGAGAMGGAAGAMVGSVMG